MSSQRGKLSVGIVNRVFHRTLLLLITCSLILFTQLGVYSGIANAAIPESIEDTLSDSREGASSKHTIIIDQTAGTSFDAGEIIIITFPIQFTVPSFDSSDVLLDDGTARTILNSCSAGANNVSIGISGQVVTITACTGFVSETAGNPISIVLGTGTTLATNPSNSGIYYMDVTGTYGDDQRGIALAITEGVTLSFTIPSPTGNVRFTGDAFPNAIITILDGGSVAGTGTANSVSFFDKTITGLIPGVHTFGIYGQTLSGSKTLTVSFNVNVISGVTVTINGILLPPIVTVPSKEKRPKKLIQSGVARHSSTVTTFTTGSSSLNHQATTTSGGAWSITVPQVLHLGAHNLTALVNDGNGNQSVLSGAKAFEILLSADLNVDNGVGLTDFSMLMFNYGLSDPPNLAADINDNGGVVDLVDFSIMMFYWTGG